MAIAKEIAKTAKSRQQDIEKLVLAWLSRWGFSTNETLQKLYPSRPRLGYDLEKRGLLRKIVPPLGTVCRLSDNNGWCYGLSQTARIMIENEMPELAEGLEFLPKNPQWGSLQHLLDLQKIFIKQVIVSDVNYDAKDPYEIASNLFGDYSKYFLTELETKKYEEILKRKRGEGYKKPNVIPDIFVQHDDRKGNYWNVWYEYDRNPKSDLPLRYWVQQLAERWVLPAQQADKNSPKFILEHQNRDEEIEKFVIVVPTQYQKERYLRFFNAKNVDVLKKTEDRKLKVMSDKPRWSPIDVFGSGILQVLTLDEAIT